MIENASGIGRGASFGFGDRTGLATPGHVQAMRLAGAGFVPVYAQQSIREMGRTARQPDQVIADAREGMRKAKWSGPWSADADHLKTEQDIERTAEAGFVLFTLDPSERVEGEADRYPETTLRERFERVGREIGWLERHRGRRVRLDTGTEIALEEEQLMRASVKYGRAVLRALELAAHVRRVQEAAGRTYEIELSVDETDHPTTLVEHLIIAESCLQAGMPLVSLAPRFPGSLEKGIDYIGDTQAFEQSASDHAAVARLLGSYKLSLHSGSDKLSIYPPFARACRGRFHLKTAGTSYLEALRVAARCEPALFRWICEFARTHYDTDRATYHVHATLDTVPPPDTITCTRELERVYLGLWAETAPGLGLGEAGRQILHCTFGSVLANHDLGPQLRDCLHSHATAFQEILADHFARHLHALGSSIA